MVVVLSPVCVLVSVSVAVLSPVCVVVPVPFPFFLYSSATIFAAAVVGGNICPVGDLSPAATEPPIIEL